MVTVPLQRNKQAGLILLMILTFLTISMVRRVKSQSLKIIGEECDGDCDERKGLTCTASKICDCMNPNATTYDSTRHICVTKAGHPCRRIGSNNLCIPHSSCSNINSPCECDRNYFQTRNGTCAPVSLYAETCNSKKPCDRTAGIECVGSKNKQAFQCQCKYPRDQYYAKDEMKCISYAGGNCSFGLPCVKNAGCSQDIFELRKGETLHGKSYYYNATVGRKCECLTGFRATKNRQCLPTYLTPCGSGINGSDLNNNVCNPEENLKCFDNKICLCQNPLQQLYYHKESHKCLNLVGSKCDGNALDSECIPNAECNQGFCSCNEGFSSTPERKCLKDFGQTCSSNECNFYRGLSCFNNTCNCLDDLLSYNQNRKICLGEEGVLCGMVRLESNNPYRDFIVESDGNQVCSQKSKDDTYTFNIECAEGLTCRDLNLVGFKQCS